MRESAHAVTRRCTNPCDATTRTRLAPGDVADRSRCCINDDWACMFWRSRADGCNSGFACARFLEPFTKPGAFRAFSLTDPDQAESHQGRGLLRTGSGNLSCPPPLEVQRKPELSYNRLAEPSSRCHRTRRLDRCAHFVLRAGPVPDRVLEQFPVGGADDADDLAAGTPASEFAAPDVSDINCSNETRGRCDWLRSA